MKHVAQVTRVLQTGIQTVGSLQNGKITPIAALPLPDRVEIVLEGGPEGPCRMYRFSKSGEFCGDTWHRTLADAYAQAAYEYGLSEEDFKAVAT